MSENHEVECDALRAELTAEKNRYDALRIEIDIVTKERDEARAELIRQAKEVLAVQDVKKVES